MDFLTMTSKTKEEHNKREKKKPKKTAKNKLSELKKDGISEARDIDEDVELLNELPPEMRKEIKGFLSLSQISGSLRSKPPYKLNDGHIDKILEISEKDDERRFQDVQQSRRYVLFYILLGISLFVFLTLFLVGKDTELFKEIIKLFISFVGGIGLGYGFKSYLDKK